MCMDSEETGLLHSVISPTQDIWKLKTDFPYGLQTMEEEIIHTLACRQKRDVIYGKYLFKGKWEKNILDRCRFERVQSSNLLKAIPIIKMCNARNTIDERCPLFYLICFHRDIAHIFIYKYLTMFNFSDQSLHCANDIYDRLNDALEILYGKEEKYIKKGMDEFAKLLKLNHEWSNEDTDSFYNYVNHIIADQKGGTSL